MAVAAPGRWSAVGGCLVLVATLFSACSTGASGDAPNSATDAAVIAGWKAALNAVDSAARTANAKSPALEATHVQPQLGVVETNLEKEHAADEVATGADRVLSVNVTRLEGTQASIVACVNGDEIVIDAGTHQPAPGLLGQTGFEEIVATMLKTVGTWKVERQSVTEGRCVSS